VTRTATLARVPSRKRSPRNRKVHRQGLSGNPQRRAEQLRERQAASWQPAVRELAYHLAGGAAPAAWWQESHRAILARSRALAWPSRLVDLETQTCQIVGDEFYERLQSPAAGLHPAQWLRALVEEAGAALRTALAQDADGWQGLWALLRGLALTAPRTPGDAASETVLRVREEFPGIRDPLQTALAEVDKAAKLLAERGLEPGTGYPAAGSRPTGEPLVARDAYGSRFLLTAPFGYDEGAPDHWYAWDIDACWLEVVVGAGAFASAEDALSEWRDAVGPMARDAALSPCPAEMTAWLLAPSLQTGVLADMLQGQEPRELIREYYRYRRRAHDLAVSAGTGASPPPFDADEVRGAFLAWYATRHDDAPAAEDVGTILAEWGPYHAPDERSFYACSPHRIEMAAHLIREGYVASDANQALRLLPEWTEWCIEHSRLDGEHAARSREAACSAASTLVDDEDDGPTAADDEAPFRRQE
jgi:hypothetical protein